MKKLSFLFTLALAAFCTTGCDSLNDLIDNIVNPSGDKDKEEPKDEKPAPTSVSLEVHGTSLEVGGDSYKIEYTVFPIEASQEVTFTSSNPAVASVDSNGYVTGAREGTATITIATVVDSTVTAAFVVTVTESGEEVENYTVTFYANGGVGHMDEDHTTGSLYVIPECEFSYDKHKFVAWALNGPSGAQYIPDEVMEQISNDIELYAVWELTPDPIVTNYTVTFDANGGSGTMAPQTTTGSSYKVPQCTFAKSGFVFVGWALNSPTGSVYYVNSTIEDIEANITLFAKWEEDDVDPTDYYAGISKTSTGESLRNDLHKLNDNKIKKLVGYDGLKTFAQFCDADPNGSGRILGFYDNSLIGPNWDGAKTWNREHVWPNSRGGGLVDDDVHMTRPASVQENSGRGSKGFGTESYDPGTKIPYYRGVCARIIFYCMIANLNLKLSEDPFNHDYSKSDPSNTMGCLSDMLKWNLEYLPSSSSFSGNDDIARRAELNRNEVIQNHASGQGNRNPFIDHPEYACKIWGGTNSTTRSVCGM